MYLRYLWYVLRHKWFVFLECCKCGMPLVGMTHDLSKFRLDEFLPYAWFFHGPQAKNPRDPTGYYKPTDTGKADFDHAWFLHCRRHPHHWQGWIMPDEADGKGGCSVKVKPMDRRYLVEMVCDWKGAGRAQGTPDTVAWYRKNGHRMLLHPETRIWIEMKLGIPPWEGIRDCPL